MEGNREKPNGIERNRAEACGSASGTGPQCQRLAAANPAHFLSSLSEEDTSNGLQTIFCSPFVLLNESAHSLLQNTTVEACDTPQHYVERLCRVSFDCISGARHVYTFRAGNRNRRLNLAVAGAPIMLA